MTHFTLGAFAIILDKNNHILLAQRNDNHDWNLPGGRIESGETPWDAVIRETKEEVGLDIEVDFLVGIYPKDYEDDIVFQFKCTAIGGNLIFSEEARDLRYFELSNLPENISPNHRERIINAFTQANKIVMKTQQNET